MQKHFLKFFFVLLLFIIVLSILQLKLFFFLSVHHMHILLCEYRAACKCKAPSRRSVMLSIFEKKAFRVFENRNSSEKLYMCEKSHTAEFTVPFLTSLFTSKL